MHERHSEMEKQNEKLETKLDALRKESSYQAVKIQNQQAALKAIHRYKLVAFWFLRFVYDIWCNYVSLSELVWETSYQYEKLFQISVFVLWCASEYPDFVIEYL